LADQILTPHTIAFSTRSPQDRQGESSRRLSGLGLGSGAGPASVLGVCCQGSYCLVAGPIGDRDGSSRNKERRRSQGSRVGASACPFQMAFKSVLLDRAEEKLLGTSFKDKLRDDILASDGKTDRIVLAFAKTQIQRVAEVIKDQAKGAISANSIDPGGHSLQYYYHKMVYNEALAQVPLNRFYQPVSICEVCYKMYGYLDHERGEAFMKDSHTLPDITRQTSVLLEVHNPLKTRSHSFTADSEVQKSGDMAVDNDNLRRSKSSGKMSDSSAAHDVGTRRILKGGQERSKPSSSHESPTTHKTRWEGESRFSTPQRPSSRHKSDRKPSPSGSELKRFLSTPGPAPRSAAPLKLFPVGAVDLGSSPDRMSITSGSQRSCIMKSRSEFSINDSSNEIFEAYKTAKSSSQRHQLTGADRLFRGKSAGLHGTTGFVAIKPLTYRVDKALEPYSAAAGPGPGFGLRSTRPLNIEQKWAKRKEEGWNQCHHVVQEQERQVEQQKRIDTIREQRLEQLKLLHLSYDQVKDQRLAKEERQRKRRLQLVQREREKKILSDKQQTQQQVLQVLQVQQQVQLHQQAGVTQERSKTKSRLSRHVEKAAKKDQEDMEKQYLSEQQSGEEEEKVQNEKESDDEEAHDTLILLEQIHQNQGKLQQELEQHLALEVEQKSQHIIRDIIRDSEQLQQQQKQQQQQQINLTNSQKDNDLQRSRRPSFSNLEVQVDEPREKNKINETANGTAHESVDNEAILAVQGAEGSHLQDEANTQLPIDPAEEEEEEGEEGDKSMGSRSNSFPTGAFRPQSAAYLIAQREACQGSLETSMSADDRDKGKIAFSPDPSPLKSTLSKSPVIGVGIPMQSQYYLGESDSFADFHPRKAGFAHHPFAPVLQASNDEVNHALEESDLSPMQTSGPVEGKEEITVSKSEDTAGNVAGGAGEGQGEVGMEEKVVTTAPVTGELAPVEGVVVLPIKACTSSSSSSTAGLSEESSPSSSGSLVAGVSVTDQCQVLEKANTTTNNASTHSTGSHSASESELQSGSGTGSGSGLGSGNGGQAAQIAMIHADKGREINNLAHGCVSADQLNDDSEVVDAYDDDDFLEESS
jgi:hypothetical protein